MKTRLLAFLLLFSLATKAQNVWTQLTDFPGAARSSAVGFVIGTKAYVGTGTDDNIFFKNFWEYDPATDTWTAKANLPGPARREAVAFSIGTDGFVGTGCCGAMSDFWRYNSLTDTWSAMAAFPQPTMTGVAFAINGKGYVCLGDDGGPSFSQKVYEYDPVLDTWTQKANFPGAGRTDALGFAMNGKGYIAIGDDGTLPMLKDLWEYDPTTDTWTQQTDFPGGPRTTATGFAIASTGKLYIGTGDDDVSLHSDFWEWDQATDTWTAVLSFTGAAMTDETGFCIGNKGYVVLGQVGQPPESAELWEYGVPSGMSEHFSAENTLTISPNPFSSSTTIYTGSDLKNASVSVYDVHGQLVEQIFNVDGNKLKFDRGELPAGLYLVRITRDDVLLGNGRLVIGD